MIWFLNLVMSTVVDIINMGMSFQSVIQTHWRCTVDLQSDSGSYYISWNSWMKNSVYTFCSHHHQKLFHVGLDGEHQCLFVFTSRHIKRGTRSWRCCDYVVLDRFFLNPDKVLIIISETLFTLRILYNTACPPGYFLLSQLWKFHVNNYLVFSNWVGMPWFRVTCYIYVRIYVTVMMIRTFADDYYN